MKGDREKVNHISITPKSAIAIVPPKKVIRALYDYEAQSSQELSFQKGDFFHVIGRENDTDWYEACNPALPDARGLVPVAFFQALGKTERDSGQSEKSPQAVRAPDHDSGYSDTAGTLVGTGTNTARSSKTMGKGSGAMVYGIVMYDFAAERPDELDAKAGEAIIVIAQSNPEWFVAKPIGRLGGPGLIPVSFIEIRDMTSGQAVTDAQEAVQRAGVPKVEEWKKMAADYKNSSITLGKFEAPSSQQGLEQSMDRMSLQQGARQSQQPNGYQQMRQSQQARPGQQVQQNPYAAKSNSQLYAPISARIPRYCFAEDKYWFVIEAALEDGRHWELSRYYEDFYDFQIQLLTEFPAEAGNTGTQKRTLPYMPGPVNYVTDAITEGRQHNLDAYVKNLLTQPAYISRCTLVKQFFAPREGDYEMDPNAVNEEYRLSGGSQQSSTDSPTNGASRQSSRGNLNGGNYAGLSAAPARVTRQTSSLSQPSSNSLSPGLNGQQPAAMKVKIYFGDDLIAIRVPTDVQFDQLYEKIRERLKIPQQEALSLKYRDESSGKPLPLTDNEQLDVALRDNDKLVLYVDYN
jgi:bud emergence protein 1